MISKIKLKIHVLGRKALFISLYFSVYLTLLRLLSPSQGDLGVVRVCRPWEVRRKSPKCLGHMKFLSSSWTPYKSKIREPVGNPTTCRASLQDFSTSLGTIEPVAESRVCTTFRHGLPTRSLIDSRTGPCGLPIGSHTGHWPMSHVRALKSPIWVLTAPYGSAFKTTIHAALVNHVRVLRNPYGPRTSSCDRLRSVCIRVFTST